MASDSEPFILYGDFWSQPTRAILFFCEKYGMISKENRLTESSTPQVIFKEIKIMGAEMKTPEFLAKNPNGRLPALECPKNGKVIFESTTILGCLRSQLLKKTPRKSVKSLKPAQSDYKLPPVALDPSETQGLAFYHSNVRPVSRLLYKVMIERAGDKEMEEEHKKCQVIIQGLEKVLQARRQRLQTPLSKSPLFSSPDSEDGLPDLFIFNELIQLFSVSGFKLSRSKSPEMVLYVLELFEKFKGYWTFEGYKNGLLPPDWKEEGIVA